MSVFKDKVLLITGGTGSFGNAVLNRFLRTDIGEIRIFSRDEKKQDDMRHDFQARMPEVANKIKFYIGDVRNKSTLKYAMKGVDYVFHAAALKQVPSCEFFLLGVVEVYILKWSVYINDAWAFLPLLTLMGFILLLQNDVKLNPSVGRWLRNTSILVYFLHPIFRLVNSKLIGVDYGGGVFVITLFESVVFASLIQALSRQIPILKKLY